MIFKLEHHSSQKDIEVLVTYPNKNRTVEQIVSFINSIGTKVECYSESSVKQVNVSDIYYIESVDKTAVIFCEKESYKTKYRLYQLYEKLIDMEFVYISKYCILNMHKLEKISLLPNSCMDAILSNGARLRVTRKYLSGIRLKLREDG